MQTYLKTMLFTKVENDTFSTEERIGRIKEVALRYLKKIDRNIEIKDTDQKTDRLGGISDHYYVLKK